MKTSRIILALITALTINTAIYSGPFLPFEDIQPFATALLDSAKKHCQHLDSHVAVAKEFYKNLSPKEQATIQVTATAMGFITLLLIDSKINILGKIGNFFDAIDLKLHPQRDAIHTWRKKLASIAAEKYANASEMYYRKINDARERKEMLRHLAGLNYILEMEIEGKILSEDEKHLLIPKI